MIPPLIIDEALQRGISLIAITDHNATANVRAVQQAAGNSGLVVLPGMELQTQEEVHVLCLFDTLEQATELQNWVDAHLPNISNNPDFFGEQFVVDQTGDFLWREERLLLNSVDTPLHEAWQVVDGLGGLFIPAHINRRAFGLMANLGFVPTDIPFEALEISRHITPAEAVSKFPQISGYCLIQNGDVHYLDDFLGAMTWTVDEPRIEELRKAIRGEDGRNCRIHPPE